MPCSVWQINLICHIWSVFSCHWLFIMTSSFSHAVSYLNFPCAFPWEIEVQVNPTVLDCKQPIFIFIRPYSPEYIPTDKPDLNYRKAFKCHTTFQLLEGFVMESLCLQRIHCTRKGKKFYNSTKYCQDCSFKGRLKIQHEQAVH